MPRNAIDTVLERLDKVKPNDKGGYRARCPAHHDEHPSLSVSETANGNVLVICRSQGCEFEAIAAALNLEPADFFADNGTGAKRSVDDALCYDYTDAAGALLFQVVRFPPKDFRQRRPDGAGDWIWNLKGVQRVLYRLPRVCKAIASGKRVFVVEGEKDVHSVEAAGFTATTCPGGAGKWRDSYTESLRGANVVVVADRDALGRKHAADVARQLEGVARKVVFVEPAKGKDVTDHLAAGLTLKELVPTSPPTLPAKKGDGFVLTHLRDLLAEPDEDVPWLVDGLLVAGGLSVVVGKPKAGKSTLLRALAVAVARGEPWIGRTTLQGPVFYLALDRDPRPAIRQHFRELGATAMDDVYLFHGRPPTDLIGALQTKASEHRPALIIVDTLGRFTRGADMNDYTAMTLALDPLLHLSRDTGAHLAIGHHSPKGDRAAAEDSPLGSSAIAGTVDTILLIRRRLDCRTLCSVQRVGEEMPETVVGLVNGCPDLTGSREDHELAKAAKSIKEFLATQSDPVVEPDVREGVEGRTTHIAKALRDLVKTDEVVRTGVGGKAGPYHYGLKKPAEDPEEKGGSVVPTIPREPGNHKAETTTFPSKNGEDTGSRNSAKNVGRSRDSGPLQATQQRPEEPVTDSMPWGVIEQAQEYVLGHPGADRRSIVDFLGLAVSEATAGRAIDYLVATGDERFAHLAGQAP